MAVPRVAAVPVAAAPPMLAAPVEASPVAAASVAAALVTPAPVAAAPSVTVTMESINFFCLSNSNDVTDKFFAASVASYHGLRTAKFVVHIK